MFFNGYCLLHLRWNIRKNQISLTHLKKVDRAIFFTSGLVLELLGSLRLDSRKRFYWDKQRAVKQVAN